MNKRGYVTVSSSARARGAIVPYASIVVPAYNCAPELAISLQALRNSSLPWSIWELIVVDDNSNDQTGVVALQFADCVISVQNGPRGPAYARNLGALEARGEVVVFIDADVVVDHVSLSQFVGTLRDTPTLAAIFGAYDTSPTERGFISQYRNLLHHFTHVRGAGYVTTFWAGCGAVRRSTFLDVGGFDAELYTRPQIEDVEFGYRLSDAGYRVLLEPSIRATHLKRWTLWSMLRTDLTARAIPWMRLLLIRHESINGRALSVQHRERALTLLAGCSVLSVGIAALTGQCAPLLAGTMVLFLLPLFDPSLLAFFRQTRGLAFALAVIPLRSLFFTVSAIGAAWAVMTPQRRSIRAVQASLVECNDGGR